MYYINTINYSRGESFKYPKYDPKYDAFLTLRFYDIYVHIIININNNKHFQSTAEYMSTPDFSIVSRRVL